MHADIQATVLQGLYKRPRRLASVAWTDFFTIIVMLGGGAMVTVLGLQMLAGDSGSIVDGFRVMLDANYARDGIYAEAVAKTAPMIVQGNVYDRMAIFQPANHVVAPWPPVIFGFLSLSIWYNVINQFMIQRVFAAKDMYHARMGIVFAGYLKIVMPLLVVVPGLILFTTNPEIMFLDWTDVQRQAGQGYVHLLQALVPVGLRGFLLATLFGTIQSTVNSVLNSTSTVFTLDIYQRLINKNASDKHYVAFGILMKVFVQYAARMLEFVDGLRNPTLHDGLSQIVKLITPFGNQAIVNWLLCVIVCVAVSLVTPPPRPDQISDLTTINWRNLNIFSDLGRHWYTSVIFWWSGFVAIIVLLFILFSGAFS